MSQCISTLLQNINEGFCDTNKPKGGLETQAVIVNRSSIDITSVTESGATITNLSLLSGHTGYSISWVKNLGGTGAEFVNNESGMNYYSNKFDCRIFTQSAEDAERAMELAKGEFVVIVETKYKGENNQAAFKVFGLESSLSMSEGSYAVNENDGSILFTLSSQENQGETYPYRILNLGGYTTTKTAFDGLFA